MQSEFRKSDQTSNLYSKSPSGRTFKIPETDEYPKEYEKIKEIVLSQKQMGREIVVVMGLGFVGAVMAAVIANAEDANGKPSKFVIGLQRPSVRSFWKIMMMNEGLSPMISEDKKVQQYINNCVCDKKTLMATYTEEVLQLADVIVVDVQCDYHKDAFGDVEKGHIEIDELKNAFHTIGKYAQPDCLTIIETTVPPGTTEHVAFPIIKEEYIERGISRDPLLAHSYERVMPGLNYIDSIQNYWRVCGGINEESKTRVIDFLNQVLNTTDYPLTILDKPIESETAKIVENSYRATILAFIDEWSLFAENNGIDITKIIKAIKVRPTHSNIMFPGPGIGGYCLPKDGALGIWAHKNLLGGKENLFTMTTAAININDTRALHAVELLEEAFSDVEQGLAGSTVALLGASYREDVSDTRNSGSEIIVRKLVELGVNVKIHDPYVEEWPELQNDSARSAFFSNQEALRDLTVQQDLKSVISNVNAIILAVRHQQYLNLFPDEIISEIRSKEKAGNEASPIVIDCFGILSDKQIARYLELGCVVKGLGRGHINNMTGKNV